ncbi:MAG: Asp-tRNA(Asn)/Glu-tRNA(Gln) amidotransferase subunit GatB [Thermodesulfobacteriota bacterium]
MTDYESVIGLEVHAQLKTETKIFCSCSTSFGEDPNYNTCPVCTGMPGVLPVLNKRAVEFAAKMGMAIGCRINEKSLFARKNYFYPDLPKGYQISQFELPLAEHGRIEIRTEEYGLKKIGVTRIHMEEDAGKSIHSRSENHSYVDFNRTGVPLIEIVSEPDIRHPEEAVAYLKSLRGILMYLDICDGNMEEGSFRCDANVSLRPKNQMEFGTRTEIKNLNSFRHVQKALEFEIERQMDVLYDGEEIVQETRLYDMDKGVTRSMRGKEEAHDYRYFPDPDLVPLVLDAAYLEKLKAEIPELPAEKEVRFIREYKLPEYDASVLIAEKELADFFERTVDLCAQPKQVSNWIMTEVMRELNDHNCRLKNMPFSPQNLSDLIRIIDEGLISNKIGRQIFPELFTTGLDPEKIVREKGLVQISDTESLEKIVEEILENSPDETAKYRSGHKKIMGFFVGQVMKKTKGQANPGVVNKILQEKLG